MRKRIFTSLLIGAMLITMNVGTVSAAEVEVPEEIEEVLDNEMAMLVEDYCEHDNSAAYMVEIEPTCTTYGKKVKHCTLCDEIISESAIAKKNHDYQWVVVTEATLDAPGLKEYTCASCGDVLKQEEISYCEHNNYVWKETQKPTCIKTKLKTGACKDCGKVLIEDYDTKQYDSTCHEKLEEETLIEATYTSTGIKAIVCEDCGYSKKETIAKLECNHPSYETITGVEGIWNICTQCKEEIGEIEIQQANCSHDGYGRKRVMVQRVGLNQEGIWNYECNNCGEVISTTTYPGYNEYTIDLGNGNTATVYGYFIDDMPQGVWESTNTYRVENGLNSLNYAAGLQNECDIRAVESAYKFDHERPNGQRWYSLSRSMMNGENLAMGYNSVDTVMTAWKNSPGHNENLLYPTFKSLAVSTFVKYSLTSTEGFPSRTYISAQTFSCYAYPGGGTTQSIRGTTATDATPSDEPAQDDRLKQDENLSQDEESTPSEELSQDEEAATDDDIADDAQMDIVEETTPQDDTTATDATVQAEPTLEQIPEQNKADENIVYEDKAYTDENPGTEETADSPFSDDFIPSMIEAQEIHADTPRDPATMNCAFYYKAGKSYWYESGIRQGTYDDPKGVIGDGTVRGREICDLESGAWYWCDAAFDGAVAANKEVWMPYIFQNESSWSTDEISANASCSGSMASQVAKAINDGTGKWVRYNANGKMYKAWYKVTAAEAQYYPDQVGNVYYYDPITGLMARGDTVIDGVTYYFDEITGVLQK